MQSQARVRPSRFGRPRHRLGPLALVAALLLAPTGAGAQIDPFFVYCVYDGGVEVARIYRTEATPTVYTEHWVLQPSYVFPNGENGRRLVIRPINTSYRNVSDYLAATFTRGCTYIKGYTTHAPAIPGRLAQAPLPVPPVRLAAR